MSGQRHREIIERLLFIREIEERRLIGGEMADEFRKKEVEDYLSRMRVNEDASTASKLPEKALTISETEEITPLILICYAHQDNNHTDANKCWLNRLMLHLTPLGLKEKSTILSDQQLQSTDAWHQYIQSQLRIVKVVILLASPNFLASIYIHKSCFPNLLKEAKENGVKVLPIILRSCFLHQTDFMHPDPQHGPEKLLFSTLYSDYCPNKPLNSMGEDEQDEFLLSFAQNLVSISNTQVQTDQDERISVSSSQMNNNHISNSDTQNLVSDGAVLQNNRENAKGWQTDVKGGSVYMAETIHIHNSPSKPND